MEHCLPVVEVEFVLIEVTRSGSALLEEVGGVVGGATGVVIRSGHSGGKREYKLTPSGTLSKFFIGTRQRLQSG